MATEWILGLTESLERSGNLVPEHRSNQYREDIATVHRRPPQPCHQGPSAHRGPILDTHHQKGFPVVLLIWGMVHLISRPQVMGMNPATREARKVRSWDFGFYSSRQEWKFSKFRKRGSDLGQETHISGHFYSMQFTFGKCPHAERPQVG
jgi:hypothetical protein